jgi:hypothetical protein
MSLVYQTPQLHPVEARVLDMIGELRGQLWDYVNPEPRRWYGTLRRMSFARAVQGSNSIEGYDASLDDVVAAVDDEPTLSADEETRLALAGYRDAMTYVLQVAQGPAAKVDAGLLKSLHFMMLKHRLDKDPGRWRPGEIFVVREPTGEQTYEGPPFGVVPELTEAMIDELEESDAPVIVRAAMAHLNLVMIHPFRDGNGRMGRALQTFVLAREEIRAPVFSSIESTSAATPRATTTCSVRWAGDAGSRRMTLGRGCATASERTTTRREHSFAASRRPSSSTPSALRLHRSVGCPSGRPERSLRRPTACA